MFEIPQGLHPNLMGLAWMIGRWEGHGRGQWPGEGEFEYGQQVDISHNGGEYLYYVSQLFTLDENGEPTDTRSMETGFWRPLPNGDVELVLTHPEGYAEVWFGKMEGAKVELVTDGVMRTASASHSYTGGQRLFGNVEGAFLWTFDRATEDQPLQSYMWARLERQGALSEAAQNAVAQASSETSAK
ncbi:MAG: FABP family protein [Propionibacteriaceae bacterium]